MQKKIDIRTCIKCGETKEIPQRNKYACNICVECQRAASRHYQKLETIKKGGTSGRTGRVPYPLNGEYETTNKKFRQLAVVTFKTKNRKEWKELLVKRLNDVLENYEVMKWINAHQEDEPIKRQTNIDKEYPDTRYMTWDEYERGLGDNEVDS
jgi:hypothetical protein